MADDLAGLRLELNSVRESLTTVRADVSALHEAKVTAQNQRETLFKAVDTIKWKLVAVAIAGGGTGAAATKVLEAIP